MMNILAFGIPGGPEWILIFLVLLLLFGAKKLPELARGIGRSLGEFRRAKDEFEEEITRGEVDQKKEEEAKSATKPSQPAQPAPPTELAEEPKEPAATESGRSDD